MSTGPEAKAEYQYEKVAICDTGKTKEEGVTPYGWGVRHIQLLIAFICLTMIFIVRAHLGVTIVAMVDDSALINKTLEALNTNVTEYKNITSLVVDDGAINNETETKYSNITMNVTNNTNVEENDNTWNVHRRYKWTKPIQEMVLSSFFLGYFLMMFPMGMVCQRFGGKLPMQIALSITGVISLLTPWLAVWGDWKAVCATRIATGLCQAGVYPCIMTLTTSWSPPSERARLTTFVYTGTVVGTVIAFQLGGFLSASSWGWPSTFWVTGILSLFTFALLTVFVSATPLIHKGISEEEKRYILAGAQNTESVQKPRTPWKAVLKSKPVWAAWCTHIGSGTAFVFFLTQVPSYLHYICGLNVQKSGALSSLPYIGNFCSSLAFGFASDFLTNRNIVKTKTARIISNSTGATGIAICLAAVSFTRSTLLAVACLVLGLVCQAGIHTGFMVNYMDVAPNYSGILTATGNTLMNVAILIVPMLVSNIVTDVTNPYQWRIVLFMVAGLSFFANIIFVVFMKAEVLPWNDPTSLVQEKADPRNDKKSTDTKLLDRQLKC